MDMIAVVIPCYKVSSHILGVIGRIGPEVGLIVVVDDCCPEKSGSLVERSCVDPRVRVVYHKENQGVGGAVMTGYRVAVESGAAVIVKIDGDGQMAPELVPVFAAPILNGEADYTKGNRFFDVETVRQMPTVRLVGNAGLSFLTKMSSGYWNLFDPTNGYTAISAPVAARLPFGKIARRYFFESDLLFRLNTMRAVVVDIPMFASYGNETSSLSVSAELPRFLLLNMRNMGKRLLYNYFIRNLNYATLELVFGSVFFAFGAVFGGVKWLESYMGNSYASAGTVMLAGLTVITGLQLLLGFANYDITNAPSMPLQKRLSADARFHPTAEGGR